VGGAREDRGLRRRRARGRGDPRGGATDRPDYRRLAESYAQMLVMLSTLGSEEVEAPEVVISYAIRRAYVSAFLRQAETFIGALGRSYLDALIYYLGLRPVRRESYGGGT
jgi:hypothetical protein